MLDYKIIGNINQPTVIFLHGAGVSSWMWADVIEYLSNVTVILVDLPGHGNNAHIPWISLNDTAKQINHIANQQLNTVHLVGLSLGAYVGFEAMKLAPRLFHSAFLSGMHAKPIPYKRIMKYVTPMMSRLMKTRYFAKKNAKILGCKPKNMDKYIQSAMQIDPRSLSKATLEVINYSLSNNTDIQTKTLFIAGNKEHPTIVESLSILANGLVKGNYQIIENVGHGWSGENPHLFAKLMTNHML